MQIGSLVRVTGDPHEILGFVMKTKGANIVLIKWLDDLCDTSWHNPEHLEVICK